jgi:hypothetical protein
LLQVDLALKTEALRVAQTEGQGGSTEEELAELRAAHEEAQGRVEQAEKLQPRKRGAAGGSRPGGGHYVLRIVLAQ